jgi:hypothetical protein
MSRDIGLYKMKNISLNQTVIAVAGLVGITVLAALGKVSSDVVSIIYASVITGALGYINGKKAAAVDASAMDALLERLNEMEVKHGEEAPSSGDRP